MVRCAGIALGHLAADAPFSLTWVSGERTAPVFEEPTIHKLEKDTPEGIVETASGLAGENTFGLSCPCSISEEQHAAIYRLKPSYPSWFFRHSHIFLNTNDFGVPDDKRINVLFIDVTPGQASAEFISGSKRYGRWGYPGQAMPTTISLKDAAADDTSPQDVIDKLVAPVVPESAVIQQIGILCPEGSRLDLSSALETRFPNIRMTWVSLSDLSRGVATVLHREIYTPEEIRWIRGFGQSRRTDLPLGISLANGKVATAVVHRTTVKTNRRVILTTSRDNQISATVQIFRGISPIGKVVLEGLVPRSRGIPRLQVSFDIARCGEGMVTVEDLDSEAIAVAQLPNVLFGKKEEIEAYFANEDSQQLQPTVSGDGVIGELPE